MNARGIIPLTGKTPLLHLDLAADAGAPVEDLIGVFWDVGPGFEEIEVRIVPPEKPLEILEQLGPSPFERGSFPLIGFLATTYDKVSRYALSRSAARESPMTNAECSMRNGAC